VRLRWEDSTNKTGRPAFGCKRRIVWEGRAVGNCAPGRKEKRWVRDWAAGLQGLSPQNALPGVTCLVGWRCHWIGHKNPAQPPGCQWPNPKVKPGHLLSQVVAALKEKMKLLEKAAAEAGHFHGGREAPVRFFQCALPHPASTGSGGLASGVLFPRSPAMDDQAKKRLAVESHYAKRRLKRLLRIEWNCVERVNEITAELEDITSGLWNLLKEIELNNQDDNE